MTLAGFLDAHPRVVRVRVEEARGSSPREAGAEMFVSPTTTYGTIGGGQLEYMALDQARALLAQGGKHTVMDVPLGPEIGQCCGGRVRLTLEVMDAAGRSWALETAAQDQRTRPQVLIFGAGHVGRALARALAPLPLATRLIDSRRAELDLADCGDKILTALPESEIGRASGGAAFVIATHDHALDFLLAAEALGRGDAAYVGMIGSATKRARFKAWAGAQAVETAALICPMGRAGLGDKRPEVIAAFIATEVMAVFITRQTIRESMEQST